MTMQRKGTLYVPSSMRTPASSSPGLGTGFGDKVSDIKAWTIPITTMTLSGGNTVTDEIWYCRLSVPKPIKNITNLYSFLTNNCFAPTNSWVAIWRCSDRSLLQATAVGAMDTVWGSSPYTWKAATFPAFTLSSDVYIGYHCTNAGPIRFAGTQEVTNANMVNTMPWQTGDACGRIAGGPWLTVPNPLPAATVASYSIQGWCLT